MPVSKPVIGKYSKQTSLQQLNSLAATPKPAQKEETSTGLTTYEIWLSRIKQTLRWRHSKYDKDWKRAYDMYNGKHWRDNSETDPTSDQPRERITVNVTMSNVLNTVPFLLNKSPLFKCKPRKPESVESAKLQEGALNYEYEQRDMNVQVKSSVYDCAEIGHGIIKTGYNFELAIPKNKKDGQTLNYADYIRKDSPFVKRICPFYFLIDPTAEENSLESARWCAEILFKSKRDILADPRYDQTVINKVREGVIGYIPGTKQTVFDALDEATLASLIDDETTSNPDSEAWVLYELWDKSYKKYYVFLDGVKEPLIEKDWPYPYIDGFPYIKVDYIPIQDELYGVGIPYSIEDQQYELNRIRTAAFQHRRRFNRKYLAMKGKVSTDEANKLVNGPDGTVVFVDMMDVIKPLEDAPMSQDNAIAEQMVKEDIRNLTGQDNLVQGGNLQARTTGTEVQARTSLFRMKMDDRVEAIDRFVVKVGVQVLQHIKNNWRKERLIEILGLDGINWEFKPLTPEQIKEEVDVSMETVSAPKIDPQVDRQQRMQIFGMAMQLLPFIQAGIVMIDINKLFAWVMEGFGYKDLGRFFTPALMVNPPLQQQQGQQGTSPQQPQLLGNGAAPNPTDIGQQNGLQAILGQLNGMMGGIQ